MRFIPREGLILLKVEIPKFTKGGIEIIETQRKVDYSGALEVASVANKSEYTKGQKILLDSVPIIDYSESRWKEKALFSIPGDDGLYALLPEHYIGGILI